MPGSAPTRQTLKHMRRLCDYNHSTSILTTRLPSTRPICTTRPATRVSLRHLPYTSTTQLSARSLSSTSKTLEQPQSGSPSSSTTKDAPPSASLPDISNFYTIFPLTLPSGPPPAGPFTIPLAALKREFLRLQSQHHPDKYTTSPTAHSKAMALSSLLNTAYKTLSDPLLRARYLLEHTYNIDITSEDNATHSGVTDPSTLMQVMEVQETIEEATTQDQIDVLKTENRSRIKETEDKLGRALESADVDTAKTECVRLNYWRSLQLGLDDWEPGKEVRLIH